MLARQRAEQVNSARMIEEQLGLDDADDFRHLAREFLSGIFKRRVAMFTSASFHGSQAWSAHISLRDGWPPRKPVVASCVRPDRRRAPSIRLSVAPMRSNGKGNPFGHRLLQLQ